MEEGLTTIAAFGYSEELSSNTKSITPILENRIYLDDINSFKIVLEHQLTKNRTTSEQYYDSVLLLEYLRSPKLSIALVTEMETREPKREEQCEKFTALFNSVINLVNIQMLVF